VYLSRKTLYTVTTSSSCPRTVRRNIHSKEKYIVANMVTVIKTSVVKTNQCIAETFIFLFHKLLKIIHELIVNLNLFLFKNG